MLSPGSHAHWDHVGRPSLFHPSTTLLVGPGVKSTYAPGWPKKDDAPILSREFEGREVTELSFSSSTTTIGGLQALDYFGDGSFYFLDAPGHAIGHVNALARTSAGPDEFMYLGADSYHHGSQLRPNEYTRLPKTLNLPTFKHYQCPGELFHPIHPSKRDDPLHASGHTDPDASPFFTIAEDPNGHSVSMNAQQARDTIHKIQAFDAQDNVLCVIAHDSSLLDVLEYFPQTANGWKAKDWKEKGRWKFLADFEKALDQAAVA